MFTINDTQSRIQNKYKNIFNITSFENRHHLISKISIINNIIEETQHVLPDERTKRIVDRFFSYLERSCESPRTINKRCLWLVTYSDIVLKVLISFRNINIYKKEIPKDGIDSFKNHIMDFIEVIQDCHIRNFDKIDPSDSMIIHDIIKNITDSINASSTKNRYKSFDFHIKEVKNYTHQVKELIKLTTTLDDSDAGNKLINIGDAVWSILRYSIGESNK